MSEKCKCGEIDMWDGQECGKCGHVSFSPGLAGCTPVTPTRAQDKTLRRLLGEGGKYSAANILVQMPSGSIWAVDPYGNTTSY